MICLSVKSRLVGVEAARPELLAEIKRITEVVGEEAVLDELSKHAVESVVSLH